LPTLPSPKAADATGKKEKEKPKPQQHIITQLGDLVLPKTTKTFVFNMNTAKGPDEASNQYTINGVSLQPPDDGPL
jgi:hypothetical protein